MDSSLCCKTCFSLRKSCIIRFNESCIDFVHLNCDRYAERYGMTVLTRYGDRAVSGSSKNRHGFDAMRAAAARDEFDVLLVDDLSRLSRDDVEMKQVIRHFKFRGIRIVGVSDGYDSDTKGEKIQSTMRGLMNEMYLDDLREKTHRGLYGKALNGYSAGGRTYGYKRAPICNPLGLLFPAYIPRESRHNHHLVKTIT